MQEWIKQSFTESIQTKIAAAEALAAPLERAASMMVHCLLNGNKILTCGNGGSAALSQLLASLLINRYDAQRPSLPAMSLSSDSTTISAIATDEEFSECYAKQIRALGQQGDILLTITSTGHSPSILNAAKAALSRDMTIIALSGRDGGEMAGLLGPNDVEIRVPSSSTARIHELHQFSIHCFCDLIDRSLFPRQDDY
ncbi:SIS domain-containing protein [Dongshaea marina]|uniref:SIS domain-containing protein n=1 Tax=Dongshaea marina TaxID=2047966 RepID=UPI000D3E57C8|nr:SIS domain-containing protein [Dongshaea marina]